MFGIIGEKVMEASVALTPVFLAEGGGATLDAGAGKNAPVLEGNGDNWTVSDFLNNSANNLQTWGGIILVILGIVAIIAGAYMLVTGLISHGKKQTSWAIVLLLFVVGGVMAFGGWNLVANTISSGLSTTVSDWGSGGSAAGTFLFPYFGL